MKKIIVVLVLIFIVGCSNQKTVSPLFTSVPQQESPGKLQLLEIPEAPGSVSIPLTISIPQQEISVNMENSVMRHGAIVNPGSSVVINSVPAFFYQGLQETTGHEISKKIGLRIDSYFNVLEQYIERGLISLGLNVKDRSKFEAKLRDLRDNGRGGSYTIALANLKEELDAGNLTRIEFAEEAKELRDKLLEASGSSTVGRTEMVDISEVIRSAQDGGVMLDYILQVNMLTVEPYTGSPLQLGTKPEIQKILGENPGLRIGSSDEKNVIPATLRQPWAQARFNAKLIDVKTGSIDWIGEYNIESLAVLDEGVQIVIGIRKQCSNAKIIIGGIQRYNNALHDVYQLVILAKRELDSKYHEGMQEVSYSGTDADGESLQAGRKHIVQQSEQRYLRLLSEFRRLAEHRPYELTMEWTFTYDIDDPIVIPDLLQPQTEEEKRRLIEHVKKLGLKVTHDLLGTIIISDENKNTDK